MCVSRLDAQKSLLEQQGPLKNISGILNLEAILDIFVSCFCHTIYDHIYCI